MAKKDIDTAVDDSLDSGNSELRVYELGFHLDPELPIEEMKKAHQSIKELISNNGAIVAEGEPQKIQLAYTISRQEASGRRDFDSAYFAWIVYESSASSHSEIISTTGVNKKVIRFIDLLTTKDAARHSEEVHELSTKMSEREEGSDDTSVAELDVAIENAIV